MGIEVKKIFEKVESQFLGKEVGGCAIKKILCIFKSYSIFKFSQKAFCLTAWGLSNDLNGVITNKFLRGEPPMFDFYFLRSDLISNMDVVATGLVKKSLCVHVCKRRWISLVSPFHHAF